MARFQYNQKDIDEVIRDLISIDSALKDYYVECTKEDAEHDSNRIFYLDIAYISRYVVDCVKTGRTDFFDKLFDKIEYVINNCDTEMENLMVVGLFEGIQNIGGREINYYSGFDKWLRPTSKIKWDNLIDSWEGTDWRKSNSNRK